MALITINSVGVIAGTIMMPITGVWTADLVIDQPDGSGFDAGTSVSIEAADGVTLKGVVAPDRTGDFLDAVHVRVLGGKGGMSTVSTPKSYASPGLYVSDVVNGILGDAGETISSTADQGVLNTAINAWTVVQVPSSQSLVALLDVVAPNETWRVLPDGTVWIGAESWPSGSDSFEIIEENPTEGTYELGIASPSIVPGVTLDGIGQVNRVQHQIMATKIRSRVWTTNAQADRGLAGAVGKLVQQYTGGIDYLAFYDVKLVSQSSDLTTVDIQPTDTRLPTLSRVPLRHGLPGCKVQVSSGAYLRLGWDNGNPTTPFAALWNGGETVTKAVIETVMLYLGAESGAEALVKKSEFNNHTHSVPGAGTTCVNGAPWTGNATSLTPLVPATGTTNVQAK